MAEAKDGCCQVKKTRAKKPCNELAVVVVKYPSDKLCRVCDGCLEKALKAGAKKTFYKVGGEIKPTPPKPEPKLKPKAKTKAKAETKTKAVIVIPKKTVVAVEPIAITSPLDDFPNGKINKTCYIDGLPMKLYHTDCCDAFSASSGDLVTVETRGLKNYWSKSYMNPKRYKPKDKEAYILGRLAHLAVTGDDLFSNQFVVKPFDFRSDKQKAWRDLHLANGMTIVKQDDVDTSMRMAEEIAKDPLAMSILGGGIPERTFIRKTKGGIYIKSRPDAIDGGDLIAADYKKSRRETDRDFIKDITNFDYTMKIINIGEGIVANLDTMMPNAVGKTIFDLTYVFIMQSDEPPYAVTTIKIEPKAPIEINGSATTESKAATQIIRDTIYLAACQNRGAVNRLEAAVESGEWPAPNGGAPIKYGYPDWLCQQLTRRIESGDLPRLDEHLNEISA